MRVRLTGYRNFIANGTLFAAWDSQREVNSYYFCPNPPANHREMGEVEIVALEPNKFIQDPGPGNNAVPLDASLHSICKATFHRTYQIEFVCGILKTLDNYLQPAFEKNLAGTNPLHIFCQHLIAKDIDTDMLALYIMKQTLGTHSGKKILETDAKGYTAVHYAVRSSSVGIVDSLLANLTAEERGLLAAMHLEECPGETRPEPIFENIFHCAARYADAATFELLVRYLGADALHNVRSQATEFFDSLAFHNPALAALYLDILVKHTQLLMDFDNCLGEMPYKALREDFFEAINCVLRAKAIPAKNEFSEAYCNLKPADIIGCLEYFEKYPPVCPAKIARLRKVSDLVARAQTKSLEKVTSSQATLFAQTTSQSLIKDVGRISEERVIRRI